MGANGMHLVAYVEFFGATSPLARLVKLLSELQAVNGLNHVQVRDLRELGGFV